MNWKRILLLTWFDFTTSLTRIKGLLFLIPFFMFWYMILRLIYDQGGASLVRPESIVIFSALYSPEIAQTLLILHPPSLSVFLIVALAAMPLFAMLSGNDQLAGDCGRKTFRFLLTRCTRAEIFLGRLLSQYLLFSLSLVLVTVIAAGVSLYRDGHSTAETLDYSSNIIMLLMIYALPFVTYMSAISALMSSALSALLMSVCIYIVLLTGGLMLHYQTGMDITLVPSGVKAYLFDLNEYDLWIGMSALLAYSVIYACAGWLIFRRRNL